MEYKIYLNTTVSFLSYRYTQRAVTARQHFQNGGYCAREPVLLKDSAEAKLPEF